MILICPFLLQASKKNLDAHFFYKFYLYVHHHVVNDTVRIDTVRVEPDDQDPRPTPEQSPLLTLDCVFARGLGLAYRSPTK